MYICKYMCSHYFGRTLKTQYLHVSRRAFIHMCCCFHALPLRPTASSTFAACTKRTVGTTQRRPKGSFEWPNERVIITYNFAGHTCVYMCNWIMNIYVNMYVCSAHFWNFLENFCNTLFASTIFLPCSKYGIIFVCSSPCSLALLVCIHKCIHVCMYMWLMSSSFVILYWGCTELLTHLCMLVAPHPSFPHGFVSFFEKHFCCFVYVLTKSQFSCLSCCNEINQCVLS